MRTVVAHVGQSAIGGLGCSRASCPLQQRPRLDGRRLRAWWRRCGRWSPVARSTRASFVHPALGWRGVRCHRRRRLRTRQRARRSGALIAHGARWRTPTSSWVHGGARRGAFSDVRVRTHASGRAWEARATGQCGLRLLLIWPKDCRLLFLSEVERREAVQLIIRGTLAVARCDGPDVRTCAPATAGRAGGRKEMKRERSVDRALIQRPSGLWAHNHLESEGRLNKSKNLSSSLRALQSRAISQRGPVVAPACVWVTRRLTLATNPHSHLSSLSGNTVNTFPYVDRPDIMTPTPWRAVSRRRRTTRSRRQEQ